MSLSNTSLEGGTLLLRKMADLRRDIAAAVDADPERYEAHHDAFPVETLHTLCDELGVGIKPELYSAQDLRGRISEAVDRPMDDAGRRHLNKAQLVALHGAVVTSDGRSEG